MNKHVDIHEKTTKRCKFFLYREICPFSDIGCKFVHENEHEDEHGHEQEDEHEHEQEDENEYEQDAEIETIEDEYSLNENQCHLCKMQLTTKDDLMDHVEADHKDYFQGMLEYAAANRNSNFLEP